VQNDGSGLGSVSWTAELYLSRRGGGGYQIVSTDHGSTDIAGGTGSVDGILCFDFPSDAANIKVRFQLDGSHGNCDSDATSGARTACGQPTPTSTPQPTATLSPTNTPVPAPTRSPGP